MYKAPASLTSPHLSLNREGRLGTTVDFTTNFLCSPLPSGTSRTPGLSFPRFCLPTFKSNNWPDSDTYHGLFADFHRVTRARTSCSDRQIGYGARQVSLDTCIQSVYRHSFDINSIQHSFQYRIFDLNVGKWTHLTTLSRQNYYSRIFIIHEANCLFDRQKHRRQM